MIKQRRYPDEDNKGGYQEESNTKGAQSKADDV